MKPWEGYITRGCIGGGHDGSGYVNHIDYITIATTGNAIDFGDLTGARGGVAGVDDSSRGCFAGNEGGSNIIDYITVATIGNATDFGDMSVARTRTGGVNNGTRGCFGGGE